jgi:GTP cyclohydrolase I
MSTPGAASASRQGDVVKASHHCMTTRGVHKRDTDLVTVRMLGCFRDNPLIRQEFLGMTL